MIVARRLYIIVIYTVSSRHVNDVDESPGLGARRPSFESDDAQRD